MGYGERPLEFLCLQHNGYSIMVRSVGAGSNLCFPLANHMSLGNLPDYLNLNTPAYKMMLIIFHPHRLVFNVKMKSLTPST